MDSFSLGRLFKLASHHVLVRAPAKATPVIKNNQSAYDTMALALNYFKINSKHNF